MFRSLLISLLFCWIAQEVAAQWTQVYAGIVGDFWKDIVFTDSFHGYIVGNKGRIKRSDDGGDSWYTQASGTTNSLNTVQFTSSDTGYISVYESSSILRSIDSGSTWVDFPVTGAPTAIHSAFFTSNDVGYALTTKGKIYKTTDACSNWSLQYSHGSNINCWDIRFVNDSTGFVVGWPRIILRTNNGGAVWDSVFSGVTTVLREAFFWDANRGD
ncbi:MAG: hypothetical protein IH946_04900, partial [Bacteroidetes bacterium]|nr:hypothetical protein [Bacteroidota bacterium]